MKSEYKFVYHTLLRACDSMLHLLQKGADFAKEKGNEEEMLNAKLAEDMFNFTRQVQIFSDNVAGGVARVAGLEKPSMPDVEKTFVELIARMNTTKDFVKSVNPDTVDGIEGRQIRLGWMPEGMYYDATDYLQKFVLQNTFFHFVTAYDILRHKGVQIGKTDFMGPIDMKK
jgi:hypothetical protein